MEARARQGETPLQMASYGNVEVIQLLIQQGADKEARDDNGWTLLHHAVNGEKLDVVRYLVQQGADTEALNNANITPLKHAQNFGIKPCIQYFKQHREQNDDPPI